MKPKIPENLHYEVDKDHYGRSFNPENPEHLQEEIINGYLTLMMMVYQKDNRTDENLWDTFREDFEGFTEDIFFLASRTALRELREILILQGVWIKSARGCSYAKTLYNCLIEDSRAEWSSEAIKEQTAIRVRRGYKTQMAPMQSLQEPFRQQQTTPHQAQQQQYPQEYQSHAYQTPQPSTPFQQPQQAGYQPQRQEYQPPAHATRQTFTPTPPQTTAALPVPKLLTELTKLYSDDKRFGGEIYDVLENKLRIFYDCCQKIGIGDDQYANAFSVMLKGRASTFYYDKLIGNHYTFEKMIYETRCHFETEEKRQQYLTEWRETTFARIIEKNSDSSRLECLEKLFDKLQTIQRGLDISYQSDLTLRDQVINACRGIPECNLALFNPSASYEGVCAQLRSAIATAVRSQDSLQHFSQDEPNEAYWTDRTYKRGGRAYNRGSSRGGGGYNSYQKQERQKKCYVCQKPGCWSNRHTLQERKDAFAKFRQGAVKAGTRHDTAYLQSFLTNYEGYENLENETDDEKDDMINLLRTLEIEDYPDDQGQFFTEFGNVDGTSVVAALNDQSVYHCLTKINVFNEPNPRGAVLPTGQYEVFSLDRYSENVFQGIMPDTGAAGVSTAGEPQFRALQKVDESAQLDTSTAGQQTIHFGKGSAVNLGTVKVQTPLGTIEFCVIPTNTPFLLCLADMDKLGVRIDNLTNTLIQGNKKIPIVRKWGHPWLLLDHNRSIAWSHLTETELRQLHRRFGHPSTHRLTRLLQRAGHEIESKMIEKLTKFCHHCQMHQNSPGRFKFTLKDEEIEFNASIIIDVLYLNGKPVLQVVDEATAFQAARFLQNMSARNAWDTLRICWIDVYLGPPDQIVHDAGKNFSSAEFRQEANSMAIEVKEVPVEAHNSVGKVERYHAPLRRAFEIISAELSNVGDDLTLQMAVKAINDSAGLDGLVPTLLVFGAYPRMTQDSPPSLSIAQRGQAIRKAMKEVQRLRATRQVNDALRTRNGPDVLPTLTLPIQSDVRVWREKVGWTGPFTLLAIDGHNCTIEMPYGPTQFRSTVVRPYYRDGELESNPIASSTLEQPLVLSEPSHQDDDWSPSPLVSPPPRRGRGRPKGSKNRPKDAVRNVHEGSLEEEPQDDETFVTAKEEADFELSKQLRAKGKITTTGAPFEASTKKEIESLIARGVFQFEPLQNHEGVRIFRSRIVNEIKGKATDTPFEKSRLVIQGYNDDGKEAILTQSPTIQRASQRLMIAIAPSLLKQDMSMQLRDITQAYVQSETPLNRLILAQLPSQIRDDYPEGTIMRILKPLYGIAEAGTHWWATYSRHHKEKLSMITSTFDPCLLISTKAFGIVGLQTDDTLILGDEEFQSLEDAELTKANFTAKPKQKLEMNTPLLFNGCILGIEDGNLTIRQKDQGKKINVIREDDQQATQQYIEQRARGAYIASICQPEASFDLSIAAQHQDPTKEDIKALNKRLIWQSANLHRGLTYIPFDLAKAKLFVFVDGSFANNKDFSSQLGYEIVLAIEDSDYHENNTFTIIGNIVHWSSTKSKRVTRSVLASEVYGMVSGVDMAIVLGTTLQIITTRLGLPPIPLIVCTDSYSLYECLVKLGTTKEKRLMIDIMALRQSYERRELFEIRWINGQDNPADAMTKAVPNNALTTLIETNRLRVRVEGWVKRD